MWIINFYFKIQKEGEQPFYSEQNYFREKGRNYEPNLNHYRKLALEEKQMEFKHHKVKILAVEVFYQERIFFG